MELHVKQEPPEWITKSRLQTFSQCQRKYYYSAIRGIPMESSLAMDIGRKFHYQSSKFYRTLDLTEKPTMTYYRSLLPNSEQIMNKYYDNFARFEAARMQTIIESGLDPQMYFIPVLNECYIRMEEHQMSGHIDRVWYVRHGSEVSAAVFEIKTGKIEMKTHLRRELTYYAYLIENSELKEVLGCPVIYGGVYSPLANDFWYEKIHCQSWQALYRMIDNMTYAMIKRTKEEEWPKDPYVNCSYCSYISLCWKDENFGDEKIAGYTGENFD